MINTALPNRQPPPSHNRLHILPNHEYRYKIQCSLILTFSLEWLMKNIGFIYDSISQTQAAGKTVLRLKCCVFVCMVCVTEKEREVREKREIEFWHMWLFWSVSVYLYNIPKSG